MYDLSKQDHIFIFHDGQQYGPMNYEKARLFVQNHAPTPSDLYWAEGMPNWQPLPELLLAAAALGSLSAMPASFSHTPVFDEVRRTRPMEPSSLQLERVSPQEMEPISLPSPKSLTTQLETRPSPAPVFVGGAPTAQPAPATMPVQALKQEMPDRVTKVLQPTQATVASPAPNLQVNPATQTGDRASKRGLGGFMSVIVLVCLLLLGASMFSFYQFTNAFIGTMANPTLAQADGTGSLQLLAFFASFGSFAACAWTIALNLYLFKKRQAFPSMFRATIGGAALFGIMVFGFILSEKFGFTKLLSAGVPSFNQWLPTHLTLANQTFEMPMVLLTGALVLIFVLMLLTMYVSRSKRVRNTFVF